MYSKKTENTQYIQIPEEQSKKFEGVIKESYRAELELNNKDLRVFGFLYPGEFVLATCIYNPKQLNEIPTSFYCSLELKENNESLPSAKLLEALIDFTGVFLDDYFSTDAWEDYFQTWQEEKFKMIPLFYRITRENIILSLEAEKLLKE